MALAATRVHERQLAPSARAAASTAELRRAPESARFARRVSHGAQSTVQKSSQAAIARISSLSQLRPQRATRVSSPADPAEREAESTARQIMRMPPPAARRSGTARGAAAGPTSRQAGTARALQRAPFNAVRLARSPARIVYRAGAESSDADPDVIQKIEASMSGGLPLSAEVRAFMEPRFEADFSGVKLHTDAAAARLSARLSARAFAYRNHIFFARGQFQPNTPDGAELLAHELTHTIQQQGVVQRQEDALVTHTAPVQIQRLGIDTVLNYIADKANIIPGFRMFTIVLGVNPVNMSSVDASPANILRAVIEFIPGAGLITQALDNAGIFDKVATWAAQQIKSLGMVGSSIKKALMDFLESLGVTDLARPGSVWERAKSIFTSPIEQIKNFVKGFITGIIEFIKDAILKPIAKLAEGTPSYDLLKGVMGKDPITGEAVADSADLMIGGFMKLIGQSDVWENMKKSGAVDKAWAWFKGALGELKSFVLQIPPTFIAAFKSLQLIDIIAFPLAFAKLAGVFGTFLGKFISWAGNAVWDLLEIIFNVVKPGAMGYVKKTGAALKSILKNPLPFVGNLAKAAKLGFQNFAGRFGKHLQAGLIDWLTGSLTGVYIPKALSLGEIVKFAFSVLGLTWTNLRAKLVKAVGEPAVQALEKGFAIVKTLVTKGPAAAWEQIKDELMAQKDKVVSGIKDMVIEAVVTKAIPKMIAMFIPGAGFISAIVSIYDIVMVFVQKISKIIEVVTAFVDSIVAIAGGAIGAAAAKVESILAGLLALAINFLAGFAGLGKIASKINGIVQKIRAPIDKALDSLAAWIKKQAKKFLDALGGKGKKDERTDAQKQADLDKAVNEGEHLLKDDKLDSSEVRSKLGAIKVKYKLVRLDLAIDADTESDETNHIEGEINPKKKGPQVKKLKKHKSTFVTREKTKYMLKSEHRNKTFTRDQCYGKRYRADVYTWRDEKLSKPRANGGLRHPTDHSKYWSEAKSAYYTNTGNMSASLDHKPMVVEHWNSDGRKGTQSARKDFFNDLTHISIMPLSANSAAGASAGKKYEYAVGKGFRGPGE